MEEEWSEVGESLQKEYGGTHVEEDLHRTPGTPPGRDHLRYADAVPDVRHTRESVELQRLNSALNETRRYQKIFNFTVLLLFAFLLALCIFFYQLNSSDIQTLFGNVLELDIKVSQLQSG